MKVIFLGVGEAFDEDLVNNSHLIDSQTKLLLDCGYAIPRHLWKHYPDKNFLDALYLTHAHADHYLGTPILLARMWEERRGKPLKLICQPEIGKAIPAIMDYAYRGLFAKLPFPIEFIEIHEGDTVTLNELTLQFAPSKHSISNFAIKVQCQGKSVCYSGDGMFSEATRRLYQGADLLIHEAFAYEQVVSGHAGIKEVIHMCEEIGVKHLALTHLSRVVRREKKQVLDYIQQHAQRVHVLLPEPLEEFQF